MSKTMDAISLLDLAAARGNVYSFLSVLMLEPPSEKVLSTLRGPEMLSDLTAVFGETPLSHWREFCSNPSEDLAALTQEYYDLFVVPLGRYIAPYEAVYRDEREVDGKQVKGLLMGESTVAAQKFYRRAGIAVDSNFLDLPDHAGIQLSFMAYLCSKQIEAVKEGSEINSLEYLNMQKSFLEEHLIPWIPALCSRICENADGPFYKGLAQLTRAFLSLETGTLNHTQSK